MPPGGPRRTPALVDLHVHSTCSCGGASSIAEYARQATALGVVEVGFCEHLDLDRRDRDYNHLNPVWYAQELAAAQAVSNGVCLRRGVEVTYQARLEGELGTWLADVRISTMSPLDRTVRNGTRRPLILAPTQWLPTSVWTR